MVSPALKLQPSRMNYLTYARLRAQ